MLRGGVLFMLVLCTVGCGPNPGDPAEGWAVTELMVEGRKTPREVQVQNPRLSWTSEQPQASYRIWVATNPGWLVAGEADLWDSGKVSSSDTEARYTGKSLAPGTRCYWRVQLFNADGAHSAEARSWWEMEPPVSWAVERLRADHLTTPLAIDSARPRLSWIVRSSRRAESQSAYRILAATDPALIEAGKPDLWDSGKVQSDSTMQVEYAGEPLVPGQRCWWRVESWNRDGSGSATARSWWEAGLPRDAWHASWIGVRPPETADHSKRLSGASWIALPEDSRPGVRYFRLRADVPEGAKIARASLLITADSGMEIVLNGHALGVPQGEGRNPHIVSLLDVTRSVRGGHNALAVAVDGGKSVAALLAQLEVVTAGGKTLTWRTDDTWRTALTAPETWHRPAFDDGDWIRARIVAAAGGEPWGELTPPTRMAPCTYLRRTFRVDARVRRARLYATALGCYELWLNGERVGEDQLTPGWTDYARRIQYQVYDVTQLVRDDTPNTVGAILGDGWYAGTIGWKAKRHHYGAYPLRLLLRLVIETDDGVTTEIGSDGRWTGSQDGPIRSSDMLMGETFDARKERGSWSTPEENTSWPAVEVLPAPRAELVAQPCPTVRKTEEVTPKQITEPSPGVYVFDLGQNMVGWTRLEVRCPEGTRIRLRFAEMTNPDGTLYTTNLRAARATDTYICRGDGLETWEPRFTFHGFRYVEVTGLPARPTPETLTGIVIGTDLTRTGEFRCSHEMVNQLQRNIVWSQRGNFLSVPTDCPQRDERLGWLGDAQIFAPTACFNMDSAAFLAKWLRDVRDAQSADGAFPNVAPRVVSLADGAPAWADAGVIVPWTLYRVYGDRDLLVRMYPAMKRWIDYVHTGNPDLLWRKRVGNNFGDWLSVDAQTPKDVLATAYFANSTRIVARTAGLLGEEEDAEKYTKLADGIVSAFNKAFVDEAGKVAGDTQTAYALALAFDLLPPGSRSGAAQRLADLVAGRRSLSTGFVGVAHLLPALSDHGQLPTAYRLLLSDGYPSWGYSIRHGATTIWERWNGWTKERGFADPAMNSFNHYAFGAVGRWLYEVVGGIAPDPAAPGYGKLLIRPRPGGGLQSAEASYDSIRGKIRCAWKQLPGQLEVTVEVPANVTARVFVPARKVDEIRENGRPVKDATGVKAAGRVGDAAVFEIGSGVYRFVVRQN